MTIKKTPTGWRVDIWPEGRYGKRVRRTFKTQAEAKRFEAKTIAKAAAGEDYMPARRDRRRLSELIQLWYDVHGSSLKNGKARLSKLYRLADKMGNPLAITITPTEVARFRQQRLDEDGISPNTANHDHAHLRAVFNVAIRVGEWSGKNLYAAIKAIKLPETELSYLDQEQINRLFQELRASKGKDVYLIAMLCLKTGARWSEGQSVRAEYIRNQSVTYVDTKNGRKRTVALPLDLYNQLKAHGPKIGRVFKSESYYAFTTALERSGIVLPRGQRTHVLRHTFASHFIMNGGDLLTLQKILGHRTIQMTMRYAHLSPGHLQEAVKYGPDVAVDKM